MAISIDFADDADLCARIKVVGVGGSGGKRRDWRVERRSCGALGTSGASGVGARLRQWSRLQR